jgi:hypothetical protein
LPQTGQAAGSTPIIREGASVKAVQRSLGHKSAVMTLDRYGHLWPDELEDLAERLDRARHSSRALYAPYRRPQRGPDTQRSRSVTCSCWWR